MLRSSLPCILMLSASAVAQNFYIPDNDPTMGTCNVIPFGNTTAGTFYNSRMQVRATAAELGGQGNLITGLGFACCGTGAGTYTSLEIVIDHIPSGQPLSTAFAANLTATAMPVLTVGNYTWNLDANTWNEVGLQQFFPYNGVDDIVIDITAIGSICPGGMRRGTNTRVYWTAASGAPPATGTLSSSATKFEVSMLTARTSSYGAGCPGTNGTPLLSFSGSAVVGSTVSVDLINGVPGGIALLLAGTTNASPYPLDLSFLNAPGCFLYTDLVFTDIALLDAMGVGSYAIPAPTSAAGFLFYTQYACLDPNANGFGFTTSNYGRVLMGF